MIDKLRLPVVLLLICLSYGITNAQQSGVEKSEITEVIEGRTYYIHFVKEGNDLQSIAKAYGVSVESIRHANEGMGQRVRANQILKIPSPEGAQKPQSETDNDVQPSERPGQSKVREVRQETGFIMHTVKKKETYYGISRQYGVTIEAIKQANPDIDVLQPGQELKIPKQEPSIKQAEEEQQVKPKTQEPAETHKVQQGETLYSLSKQYEVSINDLVKANPELVEGLKAGQVISIPASKQVDESSTNQNNETQRGASNYGNQQGEDVQYHHVKKGESLYDISRKYKVTADLLIEKNSFLKKGLEVNQRLFIPETEDLYDTLRAIGNDKVLRTEKHRVRRNESLYEIAREYNVSVERIFSLNPELKNGLEKRMKLKVPVRIRKNAEEPETGSAIEEAPGEQERVKREEKKGRYELEEKERWRKSRCESKANKDYTYNVALMLPFYLDKVDSIKAMGSEKMQPPSDYESFRFIQFYEGARLALDTLQQQGLKVRLFVYDVDEDLQKTRETLSRPELEYMDLIIGPLYKQSFSLVSDFAGNHNIKIVNPLTKRDEILSGKGIFKVQPSFDGQLGHLADFISHEYPKANIMIVRQSKYLGEEEKDHIKRYLRKNAPSSVNVDGTILHQALLAESFTDTAFYRTGVLDGIYVEDRFYERSEIEASVWDSISIPNTIKDVVYSPDSAMVLEKKGSIARKNIVIALAHDKAYVLDLITRLNVLRDTMDITLVGLPSWKDFDLEYEYLMNLELHLFGPDFIQYDHPNTEAFIRKFRREYNTEPDPAEYAYIGYDIMDFFMRALMQFGVNFEKCLPYVDASPLQMRFDFRKTGSGGYENTGTNIFRFDDYERIDLTPTIEFNQQPKTWR
ncbi:MAG: LysM peptidoglycan-binding domain-containing protein [Bacteroidales bacterium]|nr:LysM peptidoglycan-binding domain-containing protein [Bacteroidales bacterium]